MEINEPIILRTWKGNKNGSILITLPNKIIREYNLEKPTHLILERQTEGIFLRKLPSDYQIQKYNSEQQILSSEIDKEVINFEYLWHQGPSGLKDAQESAKKIFMLLKIKYGNLFSSKDIFKKMINRLGHLNNISDSKIKTLLGCDDF